MATSSPELAPQRRSNLLADPAEVVRALGSLADGVRPTSSSVLSARGGHPVSDLMSFGALARVEEHAELARRLKRVTPRERLLLLLWYAEQWPVVSIAEHLGISRAHCYRLRDRALETLVRPAPAGARWASGSGFASDPASGRTRPTPAPIVPLPNPASDPVPSRA